MDPLTKEEREERPYRRVKNEYVPEYDMCIGPNGFECVLTEPEDRTFYRDAAPLLDELNRLCRENEAMRRVVEAAKHCHCSHDDRALINALSALPKP